MGDKSNWKNKNRDILKGAIEGVKKIAAPFIKEAVGLEEAKKLLTGLRSGTLKKVGEKIQKIKDKKKRGPRDE